MSSINLTHIIKYLFTERSKFQSLSESDKQTFGFITNRMLSKRYPDFAQKLNVRSGDLSMVINLWFFYIGKEIIKDKSRDYQWVWNIKGSKKNVSKVDKKTIDLIQRKHPELDISDIEYLSDWYSKDFKDEVKYYKKLEEDYGQ